MRNLRLGSFLLTSSTKMRVALSRASVFAFHWWEILISCAARGVAMTAAGLRDRTGVPAEIRAYTLVFKHLMHDNEGDFASLVAAARYG